MDFLPNGAPPGYEAFTQYQAVVGTPSIVPAFTVQTGKAAQNLNRPYWTMQAPELPGYIFDLYSWRLGAPAAQTNTFKNTANLTLAPDNSFVPNYYDFTVAAPIPQTAGATGCEG